MFKKLAGGNEIAASARPLRSHYDCQSKPHTRRLDIAPDGQDKLLSRDAKRREIRADEVGSSTPWRGRGKWPDGSPTNQPP